MANYIRWVDVFDNALQAKLEGKYPNPEIFSQLLDEAFYYARFQGEQKKVFLSVDKDGDNEYKHYICKTCKGAFLGKKMPSRCILYECRTAYQPDCLKSMTEVEVASISQNLQFR